MLYAAAMAEVIAQRTLEYSNGQAVTSATIRIHKPEPRPTGEWCCEIEIIGLGPMAKREWFGGDSVEALFIAMQAIQLHLELQDGRATWRGDKPWAEIVLSV
jgi:hypothetical protein